jgi:uncharacterized protein (TIGR02118 family)
MIVVSLLYPNGAGARFDQKYYAERHLPMVLEKMGSALKGAFVESGIGTVDPNMPPPFIAAFHGIYDSVEAFQQAFGANAAAIQGDIPNYTDIAPVIQIGTLVHGEFESR